MDLPAGAPLAVARAALFTLTGLALGVGAHHLLSGQTVPWARVGIAAALLFAASLFGAGRRRSLATVAAACLAAQAGLHEVLGGLHVTHPAAGMPDHGHGERSMAVDDGLPGAHDAWHVRLHDSVTMTVAHVLVALAIAVVMYRADAMCWSWATSGVGPLSIVVAGIGRMFSAWRWPSARCWPGPVRRAGMRWERSPPKASVLADVVVRRGPPHGFGTH